MIDFSAANRDLECAEGLNPCRTCGHQPNPEIYGPNRGFVCSNCGKRGAVCSTLREAAIMWNVGEQRKL